MASSTPFRPVTTIQEPGLLGMPRTYTSQREVAAETGAPARGSVLGNVLGTQFATHIVLDASIQPKDGKRILVVSHCSAPAWAILLGSDDRQEGRGEHLYSQQVVPTPSQATIDADHLSTYQPIDESKTLKRTKIPRKKKTDGTYESGYPKQQVKSIGVDDLTPQKFKIQTTIVETSTTETLAAADVNNIPTPATPTGDQAKIVHQKLNDDQYKKTVTEEIIVENASPLLGEEYGDLVTKTTSELLVPDDTLADTGLAVLSSTVEPIGNGKSVKTTKTVKGGAWPDPVEQEIVSDGTKQPPARYLRDLTRTTVKKMVGAVGDTTLTGNQVAKSYKRETPDRVAETVTTEELNLTLTAIDSGVQQKPFVTITEVMTPGPAKVLPTNRSGSAKLVYEQGTTRIWENTEEVAVAREGSAGKDKDKKPFVEITTDKRYSTSDTIATASGSANIVFNDGTTHVYEISETTSTGRYGPAGAEQQIKPFVKITSTKTYEPSGVLPGDAVGSSNKVYDDGLTEVYEQSVETAEGRYGPAGAEQQTKPFVSITSTKSYEETGLLVAGEVGSTNKIYDDGVTEVYEKSVETAQVREGPAGSDKEAKPFVSIQTDKRYATDPTINTTSGSANLIFNDGTVQAYEVSEVTATAKLGAAGTATDQKPFVTLQTVKTYEATDNLGANEVGTTNKIYDDGTTEVYEKNVVNATAREGLKGVETDSQPWGAIKSTSTYTTEAEPPVGGSNQIAFTDGVVDVYEQTTKEVVIRTDEFVSAKEKQPLYLETETTSFSATPVIDKEGRTRRVFSLGDQVVYENVKTELTPNGVVAGQEVSSFLGGGVLISTEQLVDDGTATDAGFNVIKSSVKPFKEGKSIKSTANLREFPTLYGTSYNQELGVDLPFSEVIIAAADGENVTGADVEPIDKWRSKKRTADKDAIRQALEGIHLIYKSQEHVQLPNVLKSVEILATRTVGNSNSQAEGTSWGVTNHSSLAISADVGYEIEEGFNGAVPSEIHVFFISKDAAADDAIKLKTGADPWPIFRPISSRLVISGHGISKELGFRSGESSHSVQESSSVQALSNVAVLPPTIHEALNVSVKYTDYTSPTTTLNAEYNRLVALSRARIDFIKNGLNQNPPTFRGKIITEEHRRELQNFIIGTSSNTKFADDLKPTDAVVEVTPNVLQATNPTKLEAKKYVKNSSVSLYGYDMVKVTAIVVDLTTIVQ